VKAAEQTAHDGPVRIEPDLEFIRDLSRQAGVTLKKCFQCGTCSATCDMSPDQDAFPRKEMAWANWGMKDRLLRDPDVWLCYQCHDCSMRCPRSARPGEVMGAVRQACVRYHAFPRFMGRWMNRPHCIPLILGVAVALLTAVLLLKEPLGEALNFAPQAGERIIFAYSSLFPHWMLNLFFGVFTVLAVLAVLVGVRRFWRDMKTVLPPDRIANPVRGRGASIATVLGRVFAHDRFNLCTKTRWRQLSHVCVFFGFVALTVVTIWVITARYNPLIRGDFVYPLNFWDPMKVLANVGGIAVIAGCLLMAWDRLRDNTRTGPGGYFDWALISLILLVVISGFVTETLHFLRLEPHRHIAYFIHLAFVLTLLISLPYSKLAHMAYRTATLIFAERYGWTREARNVPAPAVTPNGQNDGEPQPAAS
jgi:quinone-modifying oxidoreductase subunit QmoC